MPKRPSKNVVPIYVEVHPDIKAALVSRAEQSGRTLRSEIELMIQHWLDRPLAITPAATSEEKKK